MQNIMSGQRFFKKSLAVTKCAKVLSFVTSMGNSSKLQKGKLQFHSIAIYINFAWAQAH